MLLLHCAGERYVRVRDFGAHDSSDSDSESDEDEAPDFTKVCHRAGSYSSSTDWLTHYRLCAMQMSALIRSQVSLPCSAVTHAATCGRSLTSCGVQVWCPVSSRRLYLFPMHLALHTSPAVSSSWHADCEPSLLMVAFLRAQPPPKPRELLVSGGLTGFSVAPDLKARDYSAKVDEEDQDVYVSKALAWYR